MLILAAIGLTALVALALSAGSVTVTYEAKVTVVETLPNNSGSAPDTTRKITHTNYNESATLNSGSTPPATLVAEFLVTLSSGAGAIDLTALSGTNGATVDGTGLKVQIVRVKNLGANTLTIMKAASNGHTGIFAATTPHPVPPGGHIQLFSNDNGDDIDATHKAWTLAGTGAQTSEWTIILG
jgi:hypothetical protein